VTFFAADPLAAKLRRRVPRALHDAPILLPTAHTALRRALDQWFEREGVRPRILAESDDLALMKTFGQAGTAVFPAPTAIEQEVIRQYRVRAIGRATAVRERYYAISVERRLKHPGILATAAAAKTEGFV